MKSLVKVVVVCVTVVMLTAAVAQAAPMFVATAKNLRGALYLGYGPTPGHASEAALVRCSQDSFLPPTCKVICVRMEVPPMPCPPPKVKRSVRKYRPQAYPSGYNPYARPYQNAPMPYPPR
jgi:hypothetical protein